MDVAERYVGAVAGLLRSRGIIAREVTQVGADADTIASVARHLKATLVTLVAREPTGFLRRPIRSPTEQALEACATPMYVIPAPASGEEGGMQPPVAYGRVLVPLDGTAASLEVIPAAAPFCRRFAAPMLFVHVVRSETEVWQSRDVFHDALRRAEREDIPAETLLQKGEPAEAILRTCDELRGSLIAMRTRMTEMDRLGPLGSVTVQVLRAARVPMLIVRRRSDVPRLGKAGGPEP
jgi:nucleotide-binding universal stress UspA family protein